MAEAELSRTQRRALLNKDSICFYCGAPASTVDHIIPQFWGGLSTPNNLVTCCYFCNQDKGDLSLESYRKLLSAVYKGSIIFAGEPLVNESYQGRPLTLKKLIHATRMNQGIYKARANRRHKKKSPSM
jgi:hypothetical protein